MTTAPASRPTAVPAPAPRAGSPSRPVPRIVILGGGYVGLYTALRLRRRLGRRDASIVVVDPRSYMTYQPFLPEAAAGSLEPRHVVVSHRQVLRAVDVRSGRVTQVRHAERTVRIAPEAGPEYEIGYDHLVVALGSVSRTLPIPGLAEEGIGFKHVEEAIALRNHALARLDAAASTSDADQRRRLLTFVFVGGGFAGVEALAEVEDMARAAVRGGRYEGVREEDLRFVLIEGSTRILPELGDEMGGYALEQLRRRGIEVHLATFLSSCVGGHVVTSSAQHAVRQARHLGDNLAAHLRGASPRPYRHKHVGTVASLGLGKGVAQVYGVKVRGRLAWFLHRTYHLAQMPTLDRKVRIVLDWTLALFFRRELVALGRLHDPRATFVEAAGGGPTGLRAA